MSAIYASARVCQLFADKLPILWIVLLHVVPPAVFALVDSAMRYRWRGILAFARLCLGVGALSESLRLRTGFPCGRYYFTDVMGPKILDLPPRSALAYLGMGYLAWKLALLIAGARNVLLPLVAACAMLAWDLSMEPEWATVDRAWIGKQGGPYCGAPLRDFFGWFSDGVCVLSVVRGLLSRSNVAKIRAKSYWQIAILFYAVSACGNLLPPRQPMAPLIVTDATGKAWATAEILRACSLMSVLIMPPLARLAWRRVPPRSSSYANLVR